MRLLMTIFAVMLMGSSAMAQRVLRVPEQYGSVQAAINASVAGDTVLVGPGWWGSIDLTGKDITLRSTSGPWRTVFDSRQPVTINDFNSIVIEGFMMTAGNGEIGGGLFAFTSTQGNLTLRDCIIYNNQSELGPGGAYIANASTRIENCQFLNNRCDGTDVGGLQLALGGPHLIVGTIFANNYCLTDGAAIKTGASNLSRTTWLVNCTFDGNVSGVGMPSIVADPPGTPIRMYNSILRLPAGTPGFAADLDDLQVRNSNVEDLLGVYDYGGNINADPLFVDTGGQSFRLLPGSPCIDAGDSTVIGGDLRRGDFWGFDRLANDPATPDTGIPDAQGSVIDMGAHEYQSDCAGNGILDGAEVREPFPGAGSRLWFDGLNDHAKVEGFFGVPPGECTFEFWIYAPEARGQSVFGIQNCNDWNRCIQAQVLWPDAMVYWDHGDLNTQPHARLAHQADPLPTPLRRWDHWAFVIEPSTNSTVIYRNGTVVEKRAGWGFYPDGGTWPLFIGAAGDETRGCNPEYFKGFIDEFRVWNVARSEAQIQGTMSVPLAGNEPGLIAYYPFDEGTGDTTANLCVNAFQPDAQIVGASWHDPFIADGDFNGIPDEGCADCDDNSVFDQFELGPFVESEAGISFDGLDGRAVSPSAPDYSLAGQSFSVEAWVFRNEGLDNAEYIFFHGTEGAANEGLVIGFRADDRFTFAFWANDLDTSDRFPPDALWHHWACAYDAGTNTRKIYRDGQLVASDVSSSNFLGIGDTVVGGLLTQFELHGSMDEVRIWDYARSQAEIQASMFSQFEAGSIPAELHAYYKANNSNGDWVLLDWAGQNDLLPGSGASYAYYTPDCNANGIPDTCDPDSDGDGIPDDCDCGGGSPEDCNGNGVQDGCDIADGTSQDCNGNGIPDECDIVDGTSADINGNGIPDECEADCNDNGIPDDYDIADGTSTDTNGNGVPDECERIHNVTQDSYWQTLQIAVDHADEGDEIEIRPEDFAAELWVRDPGLTIRSLDPSDPATVAATRLTGEVGVQGEFALTLEGLTVDTVVVVRDGATLRADRCLFQGTDAGIILDIYGNCDLSRSVLTGMNYAITADIGEWNEIRLTQCLVAGNDYAIVSGGLKDLWQYTVVTIDSCTFVDNLVGVSFHETYDSDIYVRNSLMRDEIPISHDGFGHPLFAFVNYTNITDGWAGDGNIDVEPLFVDAPGGDYHLAPTSPGIDAGSNLLVDADRFDVDGDGNTAEPTPLDLDGASRFYDDAATVDTGISGNGYAQVVDMGAYEYQGNPCPADFNGDGSVDTLDFLTFLNAFSAGDPRADFNGDGGVDTLDFLAFLNAFVVGC